MASNTLKTDQWVENAGTIGVLSTSVWESTPVVTDDTSTLQTDRWAFNPNAVVAYNPSLISAMKGVIQNMSFPQFVLGGQGGENEDEFELFKKTTTYTFGMFRDATRVIGGPFEIAEIRFAIYPALAAGMEITPILRFDGGANTSTGTVISTLNYPSGQKRFRLGPSNFNNGVRGTNNFYLEFQFTGAVLSNIVLPVVIDVDIDNIP